VGAHKIFAVGIAPYGMPCTKAPTLRVYVCGWGKTAGFVCACPFVFVRRWNCFPSRFRNVLIAELVWVNIYFAHRTK
jgi:hypothetical protein